MAISPKAIEVSLFLSSKGNSFALELQLIQANYHFKELICWFDF
jgi:hypothetical protein